MRFLPNILTFSRCIFAALALWALWHASSAEGALRGLWLQVAFFSFLSGAFTDLADGSLARALKAESKFGVWLDPIADKMLIGFTLMGLVMIYPTVLIIIPALAIIARDSWMTWFRSTARGEAVLSPSSLAKFKTAAEMGALGGLLSVLALLDGHPLASIAQTLSIALLWIAAALSVYTGWQYWQASGRAK